MAYTIGYALTGAVLVALALIRLRCFLRQARKTFPILVTWLSASTNAAGWLLSDPQA